MQIYDFRRRIHKSGTAMADFQPHTRDEPASGAKYYGLGGADNGYIILRETTTDVVTVTVASNSGSADPQGNAPFIGTNDAAGSAAYNVRLKSAIIAAICANPGGIKSTVTLPQSSVANAAYLQANSVYFKNIVVA